MYPMFWKSYVLQSRHGHDSGFHFLKAFLKFFKEPILFRCDGTCLVKLHLIKFRWSITYLTNKFLVWTLLVMYIYIYIWMTCKWQLTSSYVHVSYSTAIFASTSINENERKDFGRKCSIALYWNYEISRSFHFRWNWYRYLNWYRDALFCFCFKLILPTGSVKLLPNFTMVMNWKRV